MRSCALFILFVSVTLASSALAASQSDWDDCKQFSNSDRQIAGCTRVLQDQAESTSNRAIAHRNRGIAYDTLGAQDRALADIDAAIKLDPKFAAAHLSSGIVYSKKLEYDRAIAAFSEALRLDGKLAVAYSRRADAYYEKKNYDHAIADYNEAIKLDPKVAVLYVRRGNAHFHQKNYDRAIADYNRALEIDSKIENAQKNRDLAMQEKKTAAAEKKRQQEQKRPRHYVHNGTAVVITVTDNGKTVCTISPTDGCWWAATPGQRTIEIVRSDGRSIRKSVNVTASGSSGILHDVICAQDFGVSETGSRSCR